MSLWLIIELVSIAAMPAAYDMARDRGRSTTAWLNMALIFDHWRSSRCLFWASANGEALRTAR